MLWLGRGRLALVYLLVTIVALFVLAGHGTVRLGECRIIAGWLPISRAYLFTSAALFLAGMGHGLAIRQSSTGRPWYRWIAIIPTIAALVLALLMMPMRIFLYQPFNIPSASNEPTLVPGDNVFVAKLAYGDSR